MSAVKPKSKGFRFRNSFVKRLFSGKEIVKRQSDSEPSDGKDGRHNSSIKTLPAKTSSNADCLKEVADNQVASSSRMERAVDDSGADDDTTRTDDALAADTYHILSEPAASSSNPAGDQLDSVVADCSAEERVRGPPSDVASDDPAGADDRSDERSDERSDDARPAHDIATCCHARLKSMADEFRNLAKQGWYWGPLSRYEAEEKLLDCADGSFLVRDSADERYLLSISFRSYGRTLHTRIEYSNGNFSFFEFTANQTTTYKSAVQLIADSMRGSRADHQGAFCYSRSRDPHSLSYPVRLAHPVSRLAQVRSLRYLCRFTIRQFTRVDHVENLPLPHLVKGYLNQSYF